MLLQAALNGPFGKDRHPALPVSAQEMAADAVACVAAGARAIHLHPRDADGRESLEAGVVDTVVAIVREACGVPVGVTTGAWIEPDPERRLAFVLGWTAPDFTSVNLSEEGAGELIAVLLEVGVGIEAGVWSPEDAERLAATGHGDRVTRILVEPVAPEPAEAVALMDEIHGTLDRLGLGAPRLQHSDGAAAWLLIEDAIRRGVDTRVGLEDVEHGPDGSPVAGNQALVRAARALGAGGG